MASIGTLYLEVEDGTLAAANEFGKKALWKLGEGYFVDVSAVTVAHALVYAGTLDGAVCAIEGFRVEG